MSRLAHKRERLFKEKGNKPKFWALAQICSPHYSPGLMDLVTRKSFPLLIQA